MLPIINCKVSTLFSKVISIPFSGKKNVKIAAPDSAIVAAKKPLPPSNNPKDKPWLFSFPHCLVAFINDAQKNKMVETPQKAYNIFSVKIDGIIVIQKPPIAVKNNEIDNSLLASHLSAINPPKK